LQTSYPENVALLAVFLWLMTGTSDQAETTPESVESQIAFSRFVHHGSSLAATPALSR